MNHFQVFLLKSRGKKYFTSQLGVHINVQITIAKNLKNSFLMYYDLR